MKRLWPAVGAVLCVGVAAVLMMGKDAARAATRANASGKGWVNASVDASEDGTQSSEIYTAQNAGASARQSSAGPGASGGQALNAAATPNGAVPNGPASNGPEPNNITVVTGSVLRVRMIDSIDSKVNRAGDVFHASLDEPLVVDNQLVAPRGTDVYVRLVQGTTEGKPDAKNAMHLQLVKMDYEGRSYALVSSTYSAAGKMKPGHAGRNIGGGAILGTILGAAVGGGRGAAVGAVVGAAGGGVYADTHKTQQVKVAAETKLDFTLEQPVTVTVNNRQGAGAGNGAPGAPGATPPANAAPVNPPANVAPANPPADQQNNSPANVAPANPPASAPSDQQQQNPGNSAPAPTDSNPSNPT